MTAKTKENIQRIYSVNTCIFIFFLQGGQQCWALWAFLAACPCTLFIDIISLCLLIGQIKMLACLLTCNKIAGGDNTRRGKNTHTYPVTRPWGFGGVWTPHCPSGPLTRFAQNRWENIGVPPVMSYLRIRLSWAVYEITSRQRICFLFWSPQG